VVGGPFRVIWRAFPFFLSSVLLLAAIVPGCLKTKTLLLDGGHLIKNDHESYWEARYFPLAVYIDASAPEYVIQGVKDAVTMWNFRVGTNVLSSIEMNFLEDLPKGCGWIAAVQVTEQGSAGLWRGVYKDGTSKMCNGQVSVRNGVNDHNITKLFMHEIGHAFGLAHDQGDRRSIMYPTVYTDFPQYIMPDDARAVLGMSAGIFAPLSRDTRAQLNRFLVEL
jgi:hypothetical protein